MKKSFIAAIVSLCIAVICTIFSIVNIVYIYSSDKQQRSLETNSQYTTIFTQLDGIEKSIGELKSDVEELQIRVTKLETNVENLQSDVDMLKQSRYSALVPSEDLQEERIAGYEY